MPPEPRGPVGGSTLLAGVLAVALVLVWTGAYPGARAAPTREAPASAASVRWLPPPWTMWTRGWVPLPWEGRGAAELCGVAPASGATRAYHQLFRSERLRVSVYQIEHDDPTTLYEQFFPRCLGGHAVGTGPGPATYWADEGPPRVWYAALLHEDRAVYVVRAVETSPPDPGPDVPDGPESPGSSAGGDVMADLVDALQGQLASS